MTKEQILNEVATSNWQPQFEFTIDLDAVVDSINKPHEDYFLGMNPVVKEIIERGIKHCIGNRIYDDNYNYQITFADVCNWQKELFEYKKRIIRNQYINLGLRTTNVKVGNWNPPAPYFLEDLKEMCFPIVLNQNDTLKLGTICEGGSIFTDDQIKFWLTKWYKIFETIAYMEDLNGRLGGIVINILSYILTGKYLIKK